MGYACPVCEDPQSDAGHLANHLAFTAITSGGDHEEWLDENVSGWGELGEEELAERVVDDAEEREFPQVFEESGVDGADDRGHHRHGQHDHGVDPSAARDRGSGNLDDEARAIMEEARELTEGMRGEEDGAITDTTDENATDADDESGAETE